MKLLTKVVILISVISITGSFSACKKDDIAVQCVATPAEEVRENTGGCGDIFLYQFLDTNTVITVYIDRQKIDLSTKCQTFTLNKSIDGIEVTIQKSRSHPDSIYFNYCNDIVYMNQAEPDRSIVGEGRLEINVSRTGFDPYGSDPYTASALITDAQFEDSHGRKYTVKEAIFYEVVVGYSIP